VNVQFIASMSVIAPDPPTSRKLYVDALGLPLEASEGDYYFHSEHIDDAIALPSPGETGQTESGAV
jgi:hypothetical protein